MIDITADAYLYDDKVLRGRYDEITGELKEIEDVGSAANVFAGVAVQPVKVMCLSLTAGPTLINRHAYFGIKPSAGVYLDGNKIVMMRLSYTNVFNRDKESGSDFSSFAIAVGIKLF